MLLAEKSTNRSKAPRHLDEINSTGSSADRLSAAASRLLRYFSGEAEYFSNEESLGFTDGPMNRGLSDPLHLEIYCVARLRANDFESLKPKRLGEDVFRGERRVNRNTSSEGMEELYKLHGGKNILFGSLVKDNRCRVAGCAGNGGQ